MSKKTRADKTSQPKEVKVLHLVADEKIPLVVADIIVSKEQQFCQVVRLFENQTVLVRLLGTDKPKLFRIADIILNLSVISQREKDYNSKRRSREKWRRGQKVEVWTKSSKQWCVGYVFKPFLLRSDQRIAHPDLWFQLVYYNPNGKKLQYKQLRFDSQNLQEVKDLEMSIFWKELSQRIDVNGTRVFNKRTPDKRGRFNGESFSVSRLSVSRTETPTKRTPTPQRMRTVTPRRETRTPVRGVMTSSPTSTPHRETPQPVDPFEEYSNRQESIERQSSVDEAFPSMEVDRVDGKDLATITEAPKSTSGMKGNGKYKEGEGGATFPSQSVERRPMVKDHKKHLDPLLLTQMTPDTTELQMEIEQQDLSQAKPSQEVAESRKSQRAATPI